MSYLFNSLGSNYSIGFALLCLRQLWGAQKDEIQSLEKYLEHEYRGSVVLTYKGRDAITISLQALGVGVGDIVMTQAFACYAVEEAIKRAGAQPLYVDVGQGQVNLTGNTLDARWNQLSPSEQKKVKLVLVQHMFGYPADLLAIRDWCDERDLYLIEDLAQGVGGMIDAYRRVGDLADAVVFSFGRDKVVDAVSGGACVVRQKEMVVNLDSVAKRHICRDLLYPLVMSAIRNMYPIGLGGLLHSIVRQFRFFPSPTLSDYSEPKRLPTQLAPLVLRQFNQLDWQISHRRKIGMLYQKSLQKWSLVTHEMIVKGVCLRFPILVPDYALIIKKLASKHIFISDRWYRYPVDEGAAAMKKSGYVPGSCVEAERLTAGVLNLPTHQGVSTSEAQRIVKEVLACLR